jgi:glycerophosphoryl diester phosphodiesterase
LARNSEYLSPAGRPGIARVLAHRGLAESDAGAIADENTIAAFKNALAVGADYIESDIQVTKDGVAVLFHDDDLARVAALPQKIADLTWDELQHVKMPLGGRIPSLEQALLELPSARFNLDFKVAGAIEPSASVINRLAGADRILAASFSESRRKSAVRLLEGNVAESAGSLRVIGLYLAHALKLGSLFRRWASSVDVLQIPTRASFMQFATAGFIQRAHSAGLEVHYWTINEPDQMRELILLGADGLVTDRADLARKVVDSLG